MVVVVFGEVVVVVVVLNFLLFCLDSLKLYVSLFNICQASCVAVTTAIAQILQHVLSEGDVKVTDQKLDEIVRHSFARASDVLLEASTNVNIPDEVRLCFLIH